MLYDKHPVVQHDNHLAVNLLLNPSSNLTFFLHIFAESTADVSDDEIAAAEARFAALQQEIQDANVEALLTSLKEQNDEFQKTLQSYDVDLAQVEEEVANLKDIDRALPETCANDLQVEQP